MIEPPNATLMMLTLAHVQAGAYVGSFDDEDDIEDWEDEEDWD